MFSADGVGDLSVNSLTDEGLLFMSKLFETSKEDFGQIAVAMNSSFPGCCRQ